MPPLRRVHFLAIDGFADWEPALPLCELRQQGNFEVVTLTIDGRPVLSRGGLRVVADLPLTAFAPATTDLLLLAGGELWEDETPRGVEHALRASLAARRPVAAICGAVLALARAGLLEGRRHASNGRDWIQAHAPGYLGRELHVDDELAVSDGALVTASGVGYVEFTREILRYFGIYPAPMLEAWTHLFKSGRTPD